MLHHPTLDQLRHLKLHGMARAFAELGDNAQAGELDHAQWLALLLDREEAERNDRRLTYRLRNARLRHPDACIEDVDYRAPRRLDKALFQQLTTGQWITRKQNLIITGPCGVGKSWLACALGQKACRDDFSVLYKRIPRMFAELEMGRADGRYPRLFRALTRANLLILDDWGPDRLNPDQRRDLMEIVEDRQQRRHPGHQPAAVGEVARRHRRTHLRRRHPRPHRPQCPSDRPRRALHAKGHRRKYQRQRD